MDFRKIVDRVYSSWNSVSEKTTKSFHQSLLSEFDKQEITDLQNQVFYDKGVFLDLYREFDKRRAASILSQSIEGYSQKILEDLVNVGITKVESAVPQKDVEEILEFQDRLQATMKPGYGVSGYIDLPFPPHVLAHQKDVFYTQWREILSNENFSCSLKATWPNDGQVRLQSKGMGGVHPPGVNNMVSHPLITQVFSIFGEMNRDTIKQVGRSNTEFIYPAIVNHNTWHRDLMTPQLKAMILLRDVDENTAPMLYAAGSHLAENTQDQMHLYDIFRMSKDRLSRIYGGKWPSYAKPHAIDVPYFLSPDFANTDVAPKNRLSSNLTVGENDYQIVACTGKAGDVVFFDTAGLHCGTRSHFQERRNVSLSDDVYTNPKHVFFEILDKLT